MERSLAELASRIGGTVEGDGSVRIRGLASLEEAGPGQLSFYGNPRYRKELATTRASAVLLPPDEPVSRADVAWVRVASPHLAFARLLSVFHPGARLPPGVHPRAEVHASARVDPSATVMALAVVEAGAVRMRPIVMTTVCSLVAMIPIALGIGAGSELMQPLAIATVGGLTLSSILTLVVVPCGYLVLHGMADRVRAFLLGDKASASAPEEAEATAGD